MYLGSSIGTVAEVFGLKYYEYNKTHGKQGDLVKKKVVLLTHSEGGHKTEMERFLTYFKNDCSFLPNLNLISIYENGAHLDNMEENFEFPIIRDKYSNNKTPILTIIGKIYKTIQIVRKINSKYDVKVIISTGAGISILPIIFFKIFSSTKIIHIESDCRFTTKSISGRIIYFFADKFYVPHKSLLNLYKKSIYSGQL